MNQKNILLFGANGGIGSCVNQILEKTNLNVLKIDRSILDLEDLENMNENLRKILDSNNINTIDGVVYTSGLILDSKTENAPASENLENVFVVNTLAPILIHNFLQNKITSNAKFIYISSTATLGLNGLFPIYTSSKKAAEIFFKIQSEKIKRQENKFYKIICILPGPTNTPMREKIANDAATKQSPEVIANLVKEIFVNDKYENGDFIVAKDNSVEILKN